MPQPPDASALLLGRPVVLAGPKLRNGLRRPTKEEIGHRTEVFSPDGIAGRRWEHFLRLLGACSKGQAKLEAILTEEVTDLFASALQIQRRSCATRCRARGCRYDRRRPIHG